MKICILGGGTAGWLAASWLLRKHPHQHEITVIESSSIPIIGAGEGSTGSLPEAIESFGISTEEFLLGTKATFKLGIRFHNWQGDGQSYIAPIDNTRTRTEEWDSELIYHCLTRGEKSAYRSTLCGRLAEKDLSTLTRDGKFFEVASYHFDGHLVGQFLKSKILDEITLIDSEYAGCVKDTDGNITSIDLANGQTVTADYWIDATGFARVLVKEMDMGWISYRDSLTCDTAIPFLLDYKPGETISPLTEARAMSAGWMWQIPTQDRRGCGYVYDSSCISYEQAVQEIERTVGQPVKIIKTIKFDPGRVQEPFKKNVAAIGLASSFLEPLQATSIHGTVGQLAQLTNTLLLGNILPKDDSSYQWASKCITTQIDHYADLIHLHYRSGRTDTEFWRKQQSLPMRPVVARIKDTGARRWFHLSDWTIGYGGSGYGVFIYPILAYGWVNLDNITVGDNTRQKWAHGWRETADHITQCAEQCVPHTELIHRLQQGFVMPTPRIDPTINLQLHPLLRI